MGLTLFRKTLHDGRRALTWWCAGLFALGAMWMGMFPSVRSSAGQMSQYLERMPAALRALFIGQGTIDLTSPTSYLKMEAFSFMFPLLLLIYAVGAAARTIAGEEERGTLEVLLANPVPRASVFRQKLSAIVVSTTALALSFDASLVIVAAAVRAHIGYVNLLAATASSLLLAIAFAMLALAIGCARGSKAAAVALASGFAVLMYLLNALGGIVGWLAAGRRVSLFYYSARGDPLINGVALSDMLILVAFAAVCAFAAVASFRRRDLAI